jgi:hypothetical protein
MSVSQPARPDHIGGGTMTIPLNRVPDPYVVEDLAAAEITGDELVSDEDEFAAPPPPAIYTPVGDPEPVT